MPWSSGPCPASPRPSRRQDSPAERKVTADEPGPRLAFPRRGAARPRRGRGVVLHGRALRPHVPQRSRARVPGRGRRGARRDDDRPGGPARRRATAGSRAAGPPREPVDPGRLHLPRAVRRPRRHVRSRVQPATAERPGRVARPPHPQPRPRLPVRPGAGRPAVPVPQRVPARPAPRTRVRPARRDVPTRRGAWRPAAQQRRTGAHRRSPKRRERDRLAVARDVPALPQPDGRACVRRARPDRPGPVRRGAAPGALALPVGGGPRLPAPDSRRRPRRREHPGQRRGRRVPILAASGDPRASLRGFRPLPDHWGVEWKYFFDVDANLPPQRGFRIDTHLSAPLGGLPWLPEMPSLAQRNLVRGLRMGLPSGQGVARAMGIAPLPDADLGFGGGANGARRARGFASNAPLWFYVLREAELLAGGRHLGPVGGRIVAEVLVGLVAGDPASWINGEPDWRPPLARNGRFGMPELIRFASGDRTATEPAPLSALDRWREAFGG